MIGRKNLLFLGSAEAGGERASVFYSLTQSAKRPGLIPFEYLRDVIERVVTAAPERVKGLTPPGWRWAEKATGASARQRCREFSAQHVRRYRNRRPAG